MNKHIRFTISLCKKAGMLVSGEDSCEKAIRAKTGRLILLATDASDNTKKKFNNSSKFYHLPIYELCNKEDLGRMIGKEFRAVIVITDFGFASKLTSLINSENCNV